VGVLSNNDGCFVSRTPELKALGVPMGAPYFQYKDFCQKNGVAIFSSNFELYSAISDRIISLLANFSPSIEVYSIDEAFLDFSGFDRSRWELLSKQIKDTTRKFTGIPVSVGVAPTKTLAKIANNYAKKNEKCGGVVVLDEESKIDQILKHTAIDGVWGIGKQSGVKFRALNIKTAYDLKKFTNEKTLKRVFGKNGMLIQDEIRGIPCYELSEVEAKKSILSSRSFGSAVYDINSMRDAIAEHVASACESLREQNSNCSVIEVFFRTSEFATEYQHNSVKIDLGMKTTDTRVMIKYAWNALDKIFRQGIAYKKAGVYIGNIGSSDVTQLGLFEKIDTSKAQTLMSAVDEINRIMGPDSVTFAITKGEEKQWHGQKQMRSQGYLSGWGELFKLG